MPSEKLKGFPPAKKGDKFLVIKESGEDDFIVQKLGKKIK